MIERVKHGETILITDRDRPVARLQPHDATQPFLKAIHASGLLSPPAAGLDLTAFLAAPRPVTRPGHSLSAAIIAEREEAR